MYMVRGHEHEITSSRDDGFVSLHLSFQSAACHHDSFARGVPVKRRGAVRSKARKDDRRSLGGVALFDRNREAFRGVGDGSEFGSGFRVDDWSVCALSSGYSSTYREEQG